MNLISAVARGTKRQRPTNAEMEVIARFRREFYKVNKRELLIFVRSDRPTKGIYTYEMKRDIKTTLLELLLIVEGFIPPGITYTSILMKTRKREIVDLRHLFSYFAVRELGYYHREVSEFMGRPDHSTVVHSCKKTRGLLQTDLSFQNLYSQIHKALNETDGNIFSTNTQGKSDTEPGVCDANLEG
jgi:hypothetical protein